MLKNNEGDKTPHLGATILICISPGTTFNLAERTRWEGTTFYQQAQ